MSVSHDLTEASDERNSIRNVRIIWTVVVLVAVLALTSGIAAYRYRAKYVAETVRNAELRRALNGHRTGEPWRRVRMGQVVYSSLPFYQYSNLYARQVPLAFSGLFPTKESNKIQLRFTADREVTLSEGHTKFVCKDGRVEVAFPLLNKPVLQTKTLTVSSGPLRGYVQIDYWSPALYMKRGTKSSGVVLVSTDLPFRFGRRHLPKYIQENKSQMRRFLGADVVSAPATDRGLAVVAKLGWIIGREPMDRSLPLTTHKRGHEILESFLAKKTKIGCGAISYLARDYLLAAALQARVICLDAITYRNEDNIRVAFSEGHAVNEMRVDGRWQWFDLSDYCLYAKLGKDGPYLSLWALLRALHVDGKRDEVVLGLLDPKTREIRETKVTGSQKWTRYLQKYYSADKSIRYIELPE